MVRRYWSGRDMATKVIEVDFYGTGVSEVLTALRRCADESACKFKEEPAPKVPMAEDRAMPLRQIGTFVVEVETAGVVARCLHEAAGQIEGMPFCCEVAGRTVNLSEEVDAIELRMLSAQNRAGEESLPVPWDSPETIRSLNPSGWKDENGPHSMEVFT